MLFIILWMLRCDNLLLLCGRLFGDVVYVK
ncbi:Uncharacterised protein [Mycobacteroides abscessus subsp. abscessus]|nr:Uncharacterised protein [Mycobacteroides abscessus subsp. abscessus]